MAGASLNHSQLEDTDFTMTEVFVIRNQLGHYWGKGKTWLDGSQPRLVLRTKHQDEAINTLFELSSKDVDLRGDVVTTQLNERGEPQIEASQIPLTMESDSELAAAGGDDPAAADAPPAEPPAESTAPAA
jgi:hypothetical protein